ncbi:TRAPP subunit [Tilletia horrida]|nr:TRAPP subunit [Tilletia horrida]
MSYYFCIVGTRDNPVYEAELAPKPSGNTSLAEGRGLGFGRYNDRHVLQMIAHSALDVVEDVQFSNGAMYLKAVDRINEWTTSTFLLPNNVKFMILHEHKHDDGIRNFFLDVWESYVKLSINPFHDLNAPIRSASFDNRVRQSARKHL